MNKEEINAMEEVHYKKIKDMCYRYYDNEVCAKYTFIEDVVNSLIPYKDRRLFEINKLIDNLIKERDRIIEINKLGDGNE